MIAFEHSDEKTHPPGPHKHWNESFYLNFFDARDQYSGASRISFFPNQAFADGFVCMFLPDGATGFIRVWEACENHSNRSSTGAIEHICLEPFKKWRLRYDGPIYYFPEPARMGDFAQSVLTDLPSRQLSLDLEFNAIHEPFDFHASMKRALLSSGELIGKLRPAYFLNHLGPAIRKVRLIRTMSGAQHYEHAGRISGTIKVDGETYDISGCGQRDHSWGVRDMRVPNVWRWFSCQFGDELCFNATEVKLLAFRVSGGYVYHEGNAEPIADWSLEADMDESGRWAKAVTLSLVSQSGKHFRIKGEAEANIPVIVNTGGYVSMVNEARARFKWNDKTAYGISEFMGQLY
jgi:hypothetical protein